MYNKIKASLRPVSSEKGSVILMALVVLVVLTIIGTVATETSTIELTIAGNDVCHKIAFNTTDAGISGTAKLISRTLNNSIGITSGSGTEASGVTYLLPSPGTNAGDFYRQIMGFDTYSNADDVGFSIGPDSVTVDVQRGNAFTPAGGGAEFGSGAEGIGVAVVAIPFDLDSVGVGPRTSTSNIIGVYRKYIPGTGL